MASLGSVSLGSCSFWAAGGPKAGCVKDQFWSQRKESRHRFLFLFLKSFFGKSSEPCGFQQRSGGM